VIGNNAIGAGCAATVVATAQCDPAAFQANPNDRRVSAAVVYAEQVRHVTCQALTSDVQRDVAPFEIWVAGQP
jgi:hypothetical protein